MNTRDLLNYALYPKAGDDARRKSFPYYDNQVLTTGITEYFYFTTALGNQFLRNKQMPEAGTEIFFIESISGFLQVLVNTVALSDAVNELLQQSFLEISVDNRVVCKLPGLDFINFQYADTLSDQVVLTVNRPKLFGNLNSDGFLGRKLPTPIIYNSTSAFRFRFVTTAAAATAFNTVNLKLYLHGVQIDKLSSYYWDNVKNNLFQEVPVTYYETRAIANGNETTFQLFNNQGVANNLISQTFPLSDIQTMSLQNIEVFINQPDVPIAAQTIYQSSILKLLRITIDDVIMWDGVLGNHMLSMFAGFAQILTTTPNLDVISFVGVRKSKTLDVPMEFPANAKVQITLTQPATSLPVTGEFTVALRGIETRRVA